MAILFVIVNNMMLSLSLYEIMSNLHKISRIHLMDYVLIFFSIAAECYIFCNGSEALDDAQILFLRSLTQCDWQTISPASRRDICFIMRRVQTRNHIRLFNGLIVLSRAYICTVLHQAYKFVNFMHFKSVKRT